MTDLLVRIEHDEPVEAQELFEYIAKHLIQQGGRATDNSVCAYRGTHGRTCAAGCVIPDKLYRPDMEGSVVNSDHFPLPASLRRHTGLVRDLQLVHDTSLVDEEGLFVNLTDEFLLIAERRELDASFLNT